VQRYISPQDKVRRNGRGIAEVLIKEYSLDWQYIHVELSFRLVDLQNK